MVDGMQPDECTPEVSWEVAWPSVHAPDGITRVVRRSQGEAISLATGMRKGSKTPENVKLYRIERTEVDF